MTPVKLRHSRIAFRYRGASMLATGTLARVIAYSFAGLLLLIGIAAIKRATIAK